MTTEENSDDVPGIHWNPPHFYKGTEIILPRLFDGYHLFAEGAEGCNGVTLRLDAQMTADLDWREAKKEAEVFREKGYFLFWDIYLGLFQRPLNDQSQFLSLSLAIDHFREYFWKDFQDCTFGVSLYRGDADLGATFQWNEAHIASFKEWIKEQGHIPTGHLEPDIMRESEERRHLLSLFCRNAVSEYLHLLASRLPDEMLLCLLLDASSISDPLKESQILSRAAFDRFHLAVKNGRLPHQGLIWKDDTIEKAPQTESNVGFCFPPIENEILALSAGLPEGLRLLLKKGIPFKTIPEESLITEWDGLDWMIVSSKTLGPQGKRKLQGFCAAGGACATIGEPIGLTNEMDFSHWIERE